MIAAERAAWAALFIVAMVAVALTIWSVGPLVVYYLMR
jgi:hypothetical protein